MGIALLPLKTADTSGAAPKFQGEGEDIVDEAIEMFRANIMFSQYRLKGNADRTVVFLTSFIQKCLEQLSKHQKDANKQKQIIKELIDWPIET